MDFTVQVVQINADYKQNHNSKMTHFSSCDIIHAI